MTFQQLIDQQMQQRVDLVRSHADLGKTQKQAAKDLGMSLQSLHNFAVRHNVKFRGAHDRD